MFTRRLVSTGIVVFAVAGTVRAGNAVEPTIRVTKDPNCDCCSGWVAHLRQAGFATAVTDTNDLAAVKARLGVPPDLAACHTAEVAGYVLEGHVPASLVRRLLREKPAAKGLAVAGMPTGSPGMEVPGTPPEEYDVILFGRERRTYARMKGSTELVAPKG
jgi:hypothetical protein